MADSAFLTVIYQFMEFAVSMFDLLFTQILPTFALLVGAFLQFLFGFVLSFWYPDRPPSRFFSGRFFDAVSEDLYTDAEDEDDDEVYHESSDREKQHFGSTHTESWWPMQGLGGVRRSREESPLRNGITRRDFSEYGHGNLRKRDHPPQISRTEIPRTEPFDQARGRAIRNGDEGSELSFGDGGGSAQQRRRRSPARSIWPPEQSRDGASARGMARLRTPSRQIGFSRQSPSRLLSHPSPQTSSSSASSWLILKKSFKKYFSKFSAFVMSRLRQQPRYSDQRWSRPYLF